MPVIALPHCRIVERYDRLIGRRPDINPKLMALELLHIQPIVPWSPIGQSLYGVARLKFNIR
jgi:hypothetical protein